ncbi:Cof-type HAD-IIB family hydrolase [Rufibacter glacialis]|uniref:Cof-type HAD-IIB family hydrolase n=1 Tax=Rufibacter glacialis TaxID=1259555 RepID=A0A5M8QRB2_9BACT|nr:HAD family hydrolase [Rufibacter glacialis]KAA6437798.1 HAD family phosphatase [Rufibacter glacialis]GGK56143.1 haloacid dehalogenase [Rufibacter glacialis]
MDFSNTTIKLVATDMDGTLLDPQHTLSDSFYPVYQALKEQGILFAAASGRQYYNLANLFEPIKDEIIFLAENGSYVVYQGQELLVQALDPSMVRQLLQKAKTIPGVQVVLCGKKTAYVQNTDPAFMEQVDLYYDKVEVVEDLLQVTDDAFLKIAICDLAGAEANSNTYFQAEREHLQVTVSGKIWLDLCHKHANKGRAMEVIQEKFNITPEETMVFGDYLNDLKMVQKAYYSYAMENAHPDIKAAARFRAKSNSQNGVVEVLQQLVDATSKMPAARPEEER